MNLRGTFSFNYFLDFLRVLRYFSAIPEPRLKPWSDELSGKKYFLYIKPYVCWDSSFSPYLTMKNTPVGADEMTRWVEELVTKCEDINVIPGTHMEGETGSLISHIHICKNEIKYK